MEDKKALILKKRADLLTGVLEEQREDNSVEVLKFMLKGELFAIELRFVSEVSLLKEHTPLPCTPSFIFGLMSVRRQVFPIIDLSAFFSLSPQERSKTEKVIILKDEEISFAIRTGGILGVKTIPISEIQPPPVTLSGIQTEFLKGINHEGIALLDGEKLIHAKQLVVDVGCHG